MSNFGTESQICTQDVPVHVIVNENELLMIMNCVFLFQREIKHAKILIRTFTSNLESMHVYL